MLSDDARAIAELMVDTAEEHGYMDGALAVIPAMAEVEKQLFIQMFKALETHRERMGRSELSVDEVASTFSFVFAKAAEAVTCYHDNQDVKFDMLGLFDGKIPICADDGMAGYFKSSKFPGVMGSAFYDWYDGNRREDLPPVLALFEALKWTWRIALHMAVVYLEERGYTLEK